MLFMSIGKHVWVIGFSFECCGIRDRKVCYWQVYWWEHVVLMPYTVFLEVDLILIQIKRQKWLLDRKGGSS